jgi:HD-like signal output (HDOD) protein
VVEGLDRRRFWCRGIATAYYAGLVAQAALVDPEVAYLGGLMLQTGQLLMMQTDNAGVAQVESQVKAPGDRFVLEQSLLGCTHGDVTAELTRRWKFPDTLTSGFDAVSRPLEAQPFSSLGAVLHVAALMADAMDLETSAIEALNTSALELTTRLHLNLAWLEDKLITAEDLASEVSSMMG